MRSAQCFSFSAVNTAIQNAEIRQIAIVLREIETVADNEFVGNVEAAIVNFNVDFTARRLVEERADFDAVRLFVHEVINKVAHGRAGVDNVLNEQNVASFGVVIEIFEDVDLAGGVRIRVVA